jgi:Tol biopolymer transport system component
VLLGEVFGMRIRVLAFMVSSLFILAGCTTITGFINYGKPTPTVEVTVDPFIPTSTISSLATLASNEYRVISPQACAVATITTIRTDPDQSGLVAWTPDNTGLAYIAPRVDGIWYVGDLSLASGPDFSTLEVLTSDVQVSGDLLWSPDGNLIAFLAYRSEETVYTIMTLDKDGKLTDLFPDKAAVTDSYSSPKLLLKWTGNDHLLAKTTCGVDCNQMVDINVLEGSLTNSGDPVRNGTLIPSTQATADQAYDSNLYPEMTNPAWSPKGNQVAYVDENGIPWLLSQTEQTQSELFVSGADVSGFSWSPDGKSIAILLDGSVVIFRLGC